MRSVYLVFLGAGLMFVLGFEQIALGTAYNSLIWCMTAMCLGFVGHALLEQGRRTRALEERLDRLRSQPKQTS